MDDELKKRNTDCVYFLASPFTCKKGIECEYRHSEIARLNPRDCWYWLAGSCLNPSCAFRHPPLDVHTEVSSEAVPPPCQSAAPVNKLKAPCFFYFNGFCNKGDRCPFLHGPGEDGTPAWKPSKTASAVTGAPPLENKTSTVSDTGSSPIKTLPNPASLTGSSPIKTLHNPSEAASIRAAEFQSNPKPDVHLSAHTNIEYQSASPDMSASECEEAPVVSSDMLLNGTDLARSRSLVCNDQSSEEDAVDGLLEREDCLESSPGFDVLVDDDRLHNLGFEEDPEYLLSIDRDETGLNVPFSGYDYEDQVEDDPTYHDALLYYEQERYDSSDQFDRRERFDSIREFHGRSRERMLEPILPRKRKSFPANLGADDQRGGDLRNHLKKRRRVIEGRRVTHFSKRNNTSFLVERMWERPRKFGAPWLFGRLNSEVHGDRVGSFSKYGNLLRPSRPRQQYVEKRQPRQNFLSSEVCRKPVSRKRRSTEEKSNVFSGPKTLDQIREEKRRAKEKGNSSGRPGNSSRSILEEFQGPKPLSEILKERKNLGSAIEASNYSS